MSTDTRSPAPHPADSHDLIRVQGARENNLKDISVEMPKRRLTVFTGVSGSGKSSLVFGTIAAESQRMINETYSAFVQGFMPTLARPDVDVLDGLTTAIIVDQERMGANARSTVGTATDANAMLRILFSRLGSRTSARRRRSRSTSPRSAGAGAVTIERGGTTTKERRSFTRHRRHVPALRGHGQRHRHRPRASSTTTPSRSTTARSRSPATPRTAGTRRIFSGVRLLRPATSRSATSPSKELHDFLYKEPTKVKVDGINMTYEGLIPQDPEVDALQGHRGACSRTSARSSSARSRSRRARTATAPASTRARARRRIAGINIADACAMQISDLAEWVRGLDEPSVAPLLTALRRDARLVRRASGSGTCRSTGPSGTLSGRRGAAHQDDPPPRVVADRRHVRLRRADDRPAPARHPADERAAAALRDKGNTVLVVEHKPETIAIADHVVDLGPGAGTAGGTDLLRGHGRRPAGERHPHRPAPRRPRRRSRTTVRTPTGALEIRGATANNLRDVDVDIPLGVLVVITGVAGSGKSSLVHGSIPAGAGVVSIDQGAIRGSRRSNPATYTGLLEPIRKAFAKANGVKPALFSANSEGACPNCNGAGRHLHRPRDDGERRDDVRGLRGQAVRGLGARVPPRRPRHQRGARDVRDRGGGVLRRRGSRAPPPRTTILARLVDVGLGYLQPRPAAADAVRR